MVLIGVTCKEDAAGEELGLSKAYVRALEACGAAPLLLPPTSREELVEAYCGLCAGILLTGGADLDPWYFGEEPRGTRKITPERDAFEVLLVRAALKKDKPLFAICRGLQVLNVAAGGTIFQDLKEVPGAIDHWQQAPAFYPTHHVRVAREGLLFELWKEEVVRVNSFHHQAVKVLAPGFRALAWALDGVVEAVTSEAHRFVLGVQWHPEKMWEKDAKSFLLFRAFVAAAENSKGEGKTCAS